MSDDRPTGEFDIIRQLFQPIAGPDSLGLRDDVAWLERSGLIVTKDLLVAGTHFFPDDPPELIARKALRTNVSDIICKGASPAHYWLGLALPQTLDGAWLVTFADGLKADHGEFGLQLSGGDTTRLSGDGPLVISITMAGRIPQKQAPVLRSGARAGDLLAVTGTIGDAGLGLQVRQAKLQTGREDETFLRKRYLLPALSHRFAPWLVGHASAALDVSDGLIADAGHIADASGLSIRLDLEKMPLSAPAQRWVEAQEDRTNSLGYLASCGDDYQILFTAPLAEMHSLQRQAEESGTRLTIIGQAVAGEPEVRVSHDGQPVTSPETGYDHFSKG